MHTVYKINADGNSSWDELVLPQETGILLSVNGRIWLEFKCSPEQLVELGEGFLFNESIIHSREEIKSSRLCENGMIDIWLAHPVNPPEVWGRTSGCSGGRTALTADVKIPTLPPFEFQEPLDVHKNLALLQKAQAAYRTTGGVHTSILTDGEKLLASAEDIGRHNTLDKLAGMLLQQDNLPARLVIVTTGRISSEMLHKTARMKVRFVISLTSPTSSSVALAEQAGITLIGYARNNRFSIYTHPENTISPVQSDQENSAL